MPEGKGETHVNVSLLFTHFDLLETKSARSWRGWQDNKAKDGTAKGSMMRRDETGRSPPIQFACSKLHTLRIV